MQGWTLFLDPVPHFRSLNMKHLPTSLKMKSLCILDIYVSCLAMWTWLIVVSTQFWPSSVTIAYSQIWCYLSTWSICLLVAGWKEGRRVKSSPPKQDLSQRLDMFCHFVLLWNIGLCAMCKDMNSNNLLWLFNTSIAHCLISPHPYPLIQKYWLCKVRDCLTLNTWVNHYNWPMKKKKLLKKIISYYMCYSKAVRKCAFLLTQWRFRMLMYKSSSNFFIKANLLLLLDTF